MQVAILDRQIETKHCHCNDQVEAEGTFTASALLSLINIESLERMRKTLMLGEAPALNDVISGMPICVFN